MSKLSFEMGEKTTRGAEVVQIRVKLAEGAVLPRYAHPGDSGMDLFSAEEFELKPLERKLVSTGVFLEIPPGYEAQTRPKSGLALKKGLSLVNTPGTIDSGYRGEVKLIVINLGSETVKVSKGEKIAQLVIAPVARAELVVVEELSPTKRGEGGFGSTGES